MYGTVGGYHLVVVRKTLAIKKVSEKYGLATILSESQYHLPTALEPSLISKTGVVNTRLVVSTKDHVTPFTVDCEHGCCGYIDKVELVYIRPLQGHFSYQDLIANREASIKSNYDLYQILTETLYNIRTETTSLDLDLARIILKEKRVSKHKLEAIRNLLYERDLELEKVEETIQDLENVSRKLITKPKILDSKVTLYEEYPRSLLE